MPNAKQTVEKALKVDFIPQQDLRRPKYEEALKSCRTKVIKEITDWLEKKGFLLNLRSGPSKATWHILDHKLEVLFKGTDVTFVLDGEKVDKSEIYGATYNSDTGVTTGLRIDLTTIKSILSDILST